MKQIYLLKILLFLAGCMLLCTATCMGADILSGAHLIKTDVLHAPYYAPGEDANGIFGKAAEDRAMLGNAQYTASSNKLICSAGLSSYSNHRYYIFNIRFVPLRGLYSICFQTKSQQNVSEKIMGGWLENRWNNLIAVYEAGDSGSENGYATFYLNGQKVIDRKSNYAQMVLSDFRVSFAGPINADAVQMYVDEFNVYYADSITDGVEFPDPQTNGIRLLFSKLYCNENSLSVAELSFTNAVVRVYDSTDFETLLQPEATLQKGNVVVTQMNDGSLYYFEVDCFSDEMLPAFTAEYSLQGDAVSVKNADYTQSVAPDNTPAMRLGNLSDNKNAEMSFKLPFSEVYDTIKLKAQIYPVNISGVQFMTNLGTELSKRLYTLDMTLSKNEWNDVSFIYNRRLDNVSTFVGDECVSTFPADKFGVDESYCDIRMQLFGAEATFGFVKNYTVSFGLATSGNASAQYSEDAYKNVKSSEIFVVGTAPIAALDEIADGSFCVLDGFGNKKNEARLIAPGDCVLITQAGETQRFFVKQLPMNKIIMLDSQAEKTVILVGSDENTPTLYCATYKGNALTGVLSKDVLRGKVNVFSFDRSADIERLMLWNGMKPLDENLTQ